MKRLFLKAFVLLSMLLCTVKVEASKYYMNDAATANDVYTTAIGNDANVGNAAHPFLTLGKCITTASNGDTIYIDAGTYISIVNNISKSLTIIGAGTGNTIMTGNATVNRFATISANNVTIKNMTLRNYYDSNDGQVITVSAKTGIVLENLVLKDNQGNSTTGVNVEILSGSNVIVRNCLFSCSGWNSDGGGTILANASTVAVSGCIFKEVRNFASFGGGIEIQGASSVVTVNNTTFEDCSARRGGAIYQNAGILTVTNCCFKNNFTAGDGSTPDNGGGAFGSAAAVGSSCTFTNCSFTGNKVDKNGDQNASCDGGAIMFRSASGTFAFDKCSFNNISTSSYDKGQDFYIEGGAGLSGTISNCSFGPSTDATGGSKVNIFNSGVPVGNMPITNCGIYTYTGVSLVTNNLTPIRNAVSGFGTWTDSYITGTTTLNMLSPVADYTAMRTAVGGFATWTDANVTGTTTVNLLGTSTMRTPFVTGRTMAVAGGWVDGTPVSTGGATNIIMTTNTCSFTSPTLDFTVAGNEWLIFDAFRQGTAGVANTITVSISTDNGSNWTVLGTRLPTTAANVTQAKFDLSAYSGNQIKIKFETLSATGTIGAGLDNIYIYSVGSVASTLTPSMDFTPSSSYKYLAFKVAASPGVVTGMNDVNVSISTDDGSNWTLLQTITAASTTSTAITPIDISAYSSALMRIKFEGISAGLNSSNVQTGIALDDIRVYSSNLSTTITPVLDFTGKSVQLSYVHANIGSNATKNTVTVYISTNNGGSYSVVGTSNSAGTKSFDLSSYSGSQVFVKFVTLSADGTIGASIDDITFTYASAPVWNASYSGPTAVCTSSNLAACGVVPNCATDAVAPVIIACVEDKTLTGGCSAILPDYTSEISAYDDCSFIVTQSPVAGTVVSGVNTVTMTVTDGKGNFSTCTFTVTAGAGGISAPIIGTITQPTCSTATGSVDLSGLPAGTWTLTRSPGAVVTTGSGTTTTVTGLPAGTTYTFTVADATPCTSGSSANVVIDAQPTTAAPTGSATQSFCASASPTIADLVATGSSIQWYNASTAGTLYLATDALVNGVTYYATQTVGGCESASRLAVTVTINNPTSTATVDAAAICNGASTTIHAAGTGTYSWVSDPAGFASIASNPTVSPTVTTTYILTSTVGTCTASSSVVVTVNSPTATATANDAVICNGASTTINAAGNGAYSWTSNPAGFTSNSTNPVVTPTTTTTYILTSTIGSCTATSSVLVSVDAPIATPTVDNSTICEGTSTTLHATGVGTFTWTSNPAGFTSPATNPSVSPVVSTTYILTSTVGGCTASNSVAVSVNPKPTAVFDGNHTICDGISQTLSVAFSGASPWSFTYTTNGLNPQTVNAIITSPYTFNVSPSSTTTYQLTSVTDANTCSNNATSNSVVTVNPKPSVSISGTTAICNGSSTNLSVSLGGTAPWSFTYTDGVTPVTVNGVNSSPYTLPVNPSATTTYTVTNVSDANTCANTSNSNVVVTVNPLPTVSISGTTSICPGSNTDLTITCTGTAPWQVSYNSGGAPININIASSPYTLNVTPNAITTYTVTSVSDANTCANTSNSSAVVTLYTPPTATGYSVAIPNGTNTSLNPTYSGNGNPSYNWSPAGLLSTASNISNPTTVNLAGTTEYTVTYTDLTTTCMDTAKVLVIITGGPLTVNPIVSPGNATICVGDSATIFAGAGGGSGNYSYVWTSNPFGFNSTIANPIVKPVVTTTYIVTVDDGFNSESGSVVVYVNALPTPIVSATPSSICYNANSTLNATGGGSYNWVGNNLSQNNIASPIANPTISSTYTVTVTDVNGCNNTGSVSLTVNPQLTAFAGNDTLICNPANSGSAMLGGKGLTPTANGGTPAYTYNWTSTNVGELISSVANPSVSPTLTTTYTVTLTDAAGIGCTAVDNMVVTVNAPLIADAGSYSEICINNSALLNAGATSGGTPNYTYAWSGSNITSGSNSATPNVSPIITSTYTVTVTDNFSCIATDTVSILVHQLPNVSASPSTICRGDSAQLSATGADFYTWSPTDGLSAANIANPKASPSITLVYTVNAVSTFGCTNNINIQVTVNQLPQPVVASNSPVCQGNALNLSCNLAGMTSYSWEGPNSFTSTSQNPSINNVQVAASGLYTLTVTNGNGCSNTASTNVVINAKPNPIASSNSAVCEGSALNLACDLPSLTYAWSGPNSFNSTIQNPIITSATLLADGVYTVSVTNGNGCTNTALTTVVITHTNPPTSTELTQTYCAIDSAKVSDLVVTGTSVQWYSAATGGSLYLSSDLLIDGNTYYATQTIGGCESVSRLAIAVVVNNPLAPTTTLSNQSFCEIDSAKISDLVATGTSIQWYPSALGGTAYLPTDTLVNGATYYATQTVGICESVDRLAVHVSIKFTAAPATVLSNQTFCAIDSASVDDILATGTAIQWYTAPVGGVLLPANTPLVNGVTYYSTQTVSGCESASRLAVTVAINNPPAPTTTNTTQTFCAIDSATVADLDVTGVNINWYSASNGGYLYLPTDPLVNETYYFAAQTINGCVSVDRLAIEVIVNDPLAPSGQSPQQFCSNSSHTIADLIATGTAIQWYSAPVGGTLYASTDILDDGITYYATQTVGTCESVSRFDVTVTINPNPVPLVSSNSALCAGATLNLSCNLLSMNYNWSGPNTFSSTVQNPIITPSIPTNSGLYSLTVTDANACTGSASTVVTVNTNPITIITGANTVCEGILTSLTATGANTYIWNPSASTSVVNVSPSASTVYSVTGTDANGCTSTAMHTLDVIFNPNITLTSSSPYNQMYEGQSLTFTAEPSGYNNYAFYIGTTLIQSGNSNIFVTGSLINGDRVSVVATNLGCNSDNDFVDVKVIPFSNAFTPDGDNTNDIFLKGVDLTILNRWGQELYKGTEGWDGKYKGELVNQGTYFFVVSYKDIKNQTITKNGSVTLTY